jgi:SAM-dependent methyltransferase
MAESALFIMVVASIVVGLTYIFGNPEIEPLFVFLPIVLLLVPGFYAAVISGPFVPSARKRTQSMLKLANVKSDDIAYDLGFGDGRLIFAAAKNAKKAIGYELSIPLYLFGLLRKLFSRSKVSIRYGNIWNQDYRDADVVFCYLLPKAMTRFYKDVWPTLKPGTRVISNAFSIHEIKPIETDDKVYLYRR